MKSIIHILLFAIASCLFFSACKGEKKEEAKKLPVSYIETWEGGNPDTIYLAYNSKNQLIRLYDNSDYEKQLSYNSLGQLIQIYSPYTESYTTTTFTYTNNSILAVDSNFYATDTNIYSETININSSGQLLNRERPDVTNNISYTYDNQGSLLRYSWPSGNFTAFTPSTTVKGIFRESGTPDWFFVYWFDGIYPKHGYMPVARNDQDSWATSIIYETDGDGYVTKLTETYPNDVRVVVFSYGVIR